MKIEHIFSNQYKFYDTIGQKYVDHISFQAHNIIFNSVIPFPYQLNDGVFFIIISNQYF